MSYELVTLLDTRNQFVCYVTPGRARILLRDKEAKIFTKHPIIVKLLPGSEGVPEEEKRVFRSGNEEVKVLDAEGVCLAPTFAAKAEKLLKSNRAILLCYQPPTIRLFRRVSGEQATRRPTMEQRYLDSTGRIVNWTEFFKVERDIYVRNLTDTNISLQIGYGENSTYVSIFRSPDPINLTAEVSFDDVKKSQDFRKIANARDLKGRPLVQIMDEEEYREYYEAKGRALRVSSEEAVRRAEESRRASRERIADTPPPAPMHRVVESGTGPQGATHLGEKQRVVSTDSIAEDDVVRDRLRAVLFGVQLDVLEEQQKSQAEGRAFDQTKVTDASTILSELQMMPDLNHDELEYVRSKGYWKTVKRWASTQIETMAPVAEEFEEPEVVRQGFSG